MTEIENKMQPIIELIAIDIEAAINNITVANGFNQTLTAIRPRRNDFSDVRPKDRTVLIVQADEAAVEAEANMTQQWQQAFIIMAIVLDSDKATVSIDTRLNRVRADIEKKLLNDVTRSGNALDTTIDYSTGFDDGEGMTGIAVRALVNYRTVYGDPYQKA